MLALVSEFNCFLRSRCSMEMWCPDDIGRDSWDWVGPPPWERACFNFPEWGGGSSPVKTEPPQIVLLWLLLLWLLLWLFETRSEARQCENPQSPVLFGMGSPRWQRTLGCCGCCGCSEDAMSVCMSTAPQSLIGRASTPKRRPKKNRKNTAKNPRHHHRCQSREARENRPGFQVRTARSKTATRSVNWALFSIQTEWRRNASGLKSAAS